MRVSSRVAVGSPTARLAAILSATFLLTVLAAGAVVAGATYLAGPGRLVVDPNDPDAYRTMRLPSKRPTTATRSSCDPGVYRESVNITEDITLLGDGPREEVVIEIRPDWIRPSRPSSEPAIFGLVIEEQRSRRGGPDRASDGRFRPERSSPVSAVDGGSPHIHDVTSAVGVGLSVGLDGWFDGNALRQRSRWVGFISRSLVLWTIREHGLRTSTWIRHRASDRRSCARTTRPA